MCRKLTQEEFIEKALKIRPNFDFSKSVYDGNTIKVIVTCDKNHTFMIKPGNLFSGYGCKMCSNQASSERQRFTQSEFLERVKKLQPNYDFNQSIYINNTTKIKVTCDKNHTFMVTPAGLFSGRNCKICSKKISAEKRIFTQTEFIEKALKIWPNYDFSKSKYVKSRIKIKVTCDKNHTFDTVPARLLYGEGCLECARKNSAEKRTYSQEKFIEKASKLWPNYDFSESKYVKSQIKIKVTCDKNHTFMIIPSGLLQNKGCKICSLQRSSEKQTLTQEQFIEKVLKVWPNYNFSESKYINAITKIPITCDKNHTFMAAPASLLSKHGCPICKQSSGENIIQLFLIDNGINYIPQMRFYTCRNKKRLPFDFYIPDKNLLIEFQGRQHFVGIPFFGGDEGLKSYQHRDSIKSTWAKENGYNLLLLDYTMSKEKMIEILEKTILEPEPATLTLNHQNCCL